MQLLATNFAIDRVLVTHDGTSKREFIDRIALGTGLYLFHSIALLYMLKPLPAAIDSRHTDRRQKYGRKTAIWTWLNFLFRGRKRKSSTSAAAQDAADARDQCARLEGLDHVVVGAEFEVQHAVEMDVAPGQDQHPAIGCLAQFAHHVHAVVIEQAEVDNGQLQPDSFPIKPTCALRRKFDFDNGAFDIS